MKNDRAVAVVTVRKLNKMTKKNRKEVAGWLMVTARKLVAEGDQYANQFTARYYREDITT